MKSGLHVESQFLIASHHSDRDGVAGGDEERGIQHIFRLSYFLPAYLYQNVAGFDSATGGWCIFHDLRHFSEGPFHRLACHGIVDPDPAVPALARTGVATSSSSDLPIGRVGVASSIFNMAVPLRMSAKSWRAGYFLPPNSTVKLPASPPTVYAV